MRYEGIGRIHQEEYKNPMYGEFDSENHFFNIDEALMYVGDNSTYQKGIVGILSFNWGLFSFLMMGWTFLFISPIFLCEGMNDDGTIFYYKCDEGEACNSRNFLIDSINSQQSLTLEFELYCDKRYYIGLCGSLFFFGSFISGFIFPQLSDKHGRRMTIIFSVILGGGAVALAAFSDTFFLFTILIFTSGIGLSGFETISLVYVSEVSEQRTRNWSTVIFALSWAGAQFIFSILVYFNSSWRVICAVFIGGPMLLTLILLIPFLIETPRYLVSRKQYLETHKALDTISKWNRRPLLKSKLMGEMDEINKAVTEIFERKRTEQKIDEQSKNFGYTDLFRYQSLKNMTFCMLFIWFFRYFAYYGLNFSLSSLGGEIYKNFTLTAVAEFLACGLAAPIKLHMKRIPTLAGSAGLVTFSCIFIAFFKIPSECYSADNSCYQKTFSVLFAFLVKFGISLFANILITYTSELYPTVVRSLGIGINMTFGKFGNISMPFIVSALQVEEINPLVSFSIMGLLSAFFILNLKETYGEKLKDQILEIEDNKRPLIELQNSDTNNRSSFY